MLPAFRDEKSGRSKKNVEILHLSWFSILFVTFCPWKAQSYFSDRFIMYIIDIPTKFCFKWMNARFATIQILHNQDFDPFLTSN